MRERGFALVTVVLLMIGLAVLATALAFAAAQQVGVSASLHDLVRARHAADAGARAAVDRWAAARRSLDPIGAPITLLSVEFEPGVTISAAATRLDGSTWLVHSTGVVARGAQRPITAHARRLVRSLDADSVGAAFDAALIGGRVGVGAGAIVDASGSGEAPGEALCAGWATTGAAIRAPPESTSISSGASVAGAPLTWSDADPGAYRRNLGVHDLPALIGAAASIAVATVNPAPVVDGAACDTAVATNWGAPDGPCAAHFALAHASGPLTVNGGYGQGILIVSGDLVLDGGFRFSGLIIASGSVSVRDAELEGAVAAAAIDAEARARVYLDRCAIGAALTRTPALDRALIPRRSWLPTFD